MGVKDWVAGLGSKVQQWLAGLDGLMRPAPVPVPVPVRVRNPNRSERR